MVIAESLAIQSYIPQKKHLGGHFRYFLFFFGLGVGKREEASKQVAGVSVLIENRGAGVGAQVYLEDVCREEEEEGGGSKFLFRGQNSHQDTEFGPRGPSPKHLLKVFFRSNLARQNLKRCKGHTHKKGIGKISIERHEFQSGYSQGVFGVFSGSFRVFSGCFALCPFWVCPLEPFKKTRTS